MAEKMVLLHHMTLDGLIFGPELESAIKFGVRGGQPPGYAVVPEDHPLLPSLLESEPVEVVDNSAPGRVYVCPVCDKEIKTKAALKAHLATHDMKVADEGEGTTEE